MVTPFLYLTKEKSRKDFDAIVLMQAETLLLTNAITSLTKILVYRPRPYAYNESFPIEEKLNFNARESFFSGHVAATASMSFFTATVFSQYYPDSKLKPLVWSYGVLWPAATGYFRYTAGKHFPTDILTGYLVGAMTGILIPKIHQKIAKKKEEKRIIWN
jgi:membrane-associated phospholipid phosphatase